MEEIRKVITAPGEYIDFETVYEEDPMMKDNGVPMKVGKVEKLEYETAVYEDGKTYQKYVNVYLPAGYDPEDKETKYDVVYYQHGNSCDPELINIPEFRRNIDTMFNKSHNAPFILVHTTYYFDVWENVKERRKTGGVPAGDGNWNAETKANFYREVVEDIIPLVELKYNTYLTSGDAESIKATRDHRAFTGYSRGAVCTWYMLHNAFEYFRYFVPMSCMTTAGKGIREPLSEQEVIDYLTAPMKAHPELPFFIFGINGKDFDAKPMVTQMKYLTKEPVFSYGPDPIKNNIYYSLSDYHHTDLYAPIYMDNATHCIFEGKHNTHR